MAETELMKFIVRLPSRLHQKIKRRATLNNTSMNKEMINILTESFSKSSTDKTLAELVRRLEEKKVI